MTVLRGASLFGWWATMADDEAGNTSPRVAQVPTPRLHHTEHPDSATIVMMAGREMSFPTKSRLAPWWRGHSEAHSLPWMSLVPPT